MPLCNKEEEKILRSWEILSLSSNCSLGHNDCKGLFVEAKITLKIKAKVIKTSLKQRKTKAKKTDATSD